MSSFGTILIRSFDSSVGRAVDCSGTKLSIGRWFESGSKDNFFFFPFLSVFFFLSISFYVFFSFHFFLCFFLSISFCVFFSFHFFLFFFPFLSVFFSISFCVFFSFHFFLCFFFFSFFLLLLFGTSNYLFYHSGTISNPFFTSSLRYVFLAYTLPPSPEASVLSASVLEPSPVPGLDTLEEGEDKKRFFADLEASQGTPLDYSELNRQLGETGQSSLTFR